MKLEASTIKKKLADIINGKKNTKTINDFLEYSYREEIMTNKVLLYDGKESFAWGELDPKYGVIQNR